jgi:hypothetical protein
VLCKLHELCNNTLSKALFKCPTRKASDRAPTQGRACSRTARIIVHGHSLHFLPHPSPSTSVEHSRGHEHSGHRSRVVNVELDHFNSAVVFAGLGGTYVASRRVDGARPERSSHVTANSLTTMGVKLHTPTLEYVLLGRAEYLHTLVTLYYAQRSQNYSLR